MIKKIKKAIILSSGGLDSTYNAIKASTEYDKLVFLFLDYGQKAMSQEFIAVKKLSQVLGAKLLRLALPFYNDLKSTLTSQSQKVTEYKSLDKISNEKVPGEWVPNRNAVFTMTAGAVAESMNITDIIIGINKEEAGRYPDNTKEFLDRANSLLEFSTIKNVNIKSYSIDMDKTEIYTDLLKLIDRFNLKEGDLKEYIWSCYYSYPKMCGVCESCLRLKNVVDRSWDDKFIQ